LLLEPGTGPQRKLRSPRPLGERSSLHDFVLQAIPPIEVGRNCAQSSHGLAPITPKPLIFRREQAAFSPVTLASFALPVRIVRASLPGKGFPKRLAARAGRLGTAAGTRADAADSDCCGRAPARRRLAAPGCGAKSHNHVAFMGFSAPEKPMRRQGRTDSACALCVICAISRRTAPAGGERGACASGAILRTDSSSPGLAAPVAVRAYTAR
jgi:hypothetical protein